MSIVNMRAVQHAVAVAVMAAGLALALAIGLHVRSLAIDTGDLSAVTMVLAFIACVAFCLLRLGRPALATAIFAATMLFAIILLALLETALLATLGRPFADPGLAAADAIVAPWLDWHALALWFSHHPAVAAACEWIYHSIAWQPFVLIAALCWTRQPGEAWRFVGMWTLGLIICQLVFALLPGTGAYVFHHVDAALASPSSLAVSSGQLRLLTMLRGSSLTMIDSRCIGGMITFPSFHAVAAVLLARGFWRIDVLRRPFVALNAAMFATAIPIGGHYVVDLIAGVATAFLAIRVFDAPPLRWDGFVGRHRLSEVRC